MSLRNPADFRLLSRHILHFLTDCDVFDFILKYLYIILTQKEKQVMKIQYRLLFVYLDFSTQLLFQFILNMFTNLSANI